MSTAKSTPHPPLSVFAVMIAQVGESGKSFFPFCAVFQKQYMLKKATTPGPQSYSMPHRWASSWTNTQ